MPAAAASFRCPRLAAPGYCGDGGPAARAGLAFPTDVAALAGGGYAIADAGNDAVREVGANGRIRTLAARRLRFPAGIAADAAGRVLVADSGHGRVAAIDRRGRVTTLAAGLASPLAVAAEPDGSILIADTGHDRVLRRSAGGALSVVAGSGARGFGGDGGPARLARLDQPVDVAPALGGVVIATADGRLRRVSPDGTIASLMPEPLAGPPGIAATARGDLLVTAPHARTVLRLSADGRLRRVAGGGRCGSGLAYPAGVAATPGGGVLVADSGAQRVLAVARGRVRVAAGGGLAVPRSACAAGNAPARLLARRGPAPGAGDAPYAPPPTCNERAFWTFNLAYLFSIPARPRARRAFALVFNASRPVRVHLLAQQGRLHRRVPLGGDAVTHHARFSLRFPHGLPRPGRYALRLTARAGGRTQCLNLRIRVRR